MIDRTDLAACRALLKNGSKTFLAASWLLPRSVRDAACVLYAFCRLADDAVDAEVAGASGAVVSLRERLDAVYAGRPLPIAADRALAVVVSRHRIPRTLPDALIEGFAWDAAGRRYETIDELHDYAARVAGAVGAMMALLMDVRSDAELARACDLGVAMQLSNIARDVGEDARMGRLYLPRQWMREAGIDPDTWLRDPVHSDALGSVIRRLLDDAEALYTRVGAGIARLPLACRPGINAARHLYAEIGNEVMRRGLDAVSQRAVVSARRKATVLLFAMTGSLFASSTSNASALPATRFLVDAAAEHDASAALPASWDVAAKAIWTLELFDRLERRERVVRPVRRGRTVVPRRAGTLA